MSRAKLKQHKRYLFYRVYCLGAIIAWNATALLWGCSQSLTHRFTQSYLREGLPLLMMIPITLPALFLLSNLRAFPFEFSVFGPCERTPLPKEEPILKQSWLGGRVGWAYGGITWSIYTSGIGVSILGAGKAFVPVEHIAELRPSFLSGYILRHNSPELRNPVTLPSYELVEALQSLMSKHRKYSSDSLDS
jgi:hypothetical protein